MHYNATFVAVLSDKCTRQTFLVIVNLMSGLLTENSALPVDYNAQTFL